MSRVGKNPIPMPAGVSVALSGQEVNVKGPKGALTFHAPPEVAISQEAGMIRVTPRDETKRARAMWGTARAIIAAHVKGVSEGFTRTLELQGVGYRAAMKGKDLQLQLGFSHDVIYQPREGVTIAVTKPTEIVLTGVDQQALGQTAAEIRGFRPPEPYKGKGVRLAGEFVRRKEGKKK